MACDEVLLEARLDGGLELLDPSHDLLDLRVAPHGSSSAIRAPVPAALPAELTWAGSQSGTSPSTRAWTGSMWAAERPGEPDPRDPFEPVALEEQHAARVERGLGELDLADVVLRHAQLGLARMEDVRPGPTVGDDARAPRGEAPVDRAVGRDHAGEMQLGDRLDDPGAADARDARLREAGLVRPRLAADHAYARLERLRVDPHALDRAGRGSLPAGDLRSLEGGPGRARGGEEPLAVPEHDLGVRADVDDQVHLVGEMRRLREDHPRGVGADVARDARQDVRTGTGVDGKPELGRGQPHRLVDGEREGRAAELGRVEPEQEVVHHRVPDERDLEDVRPLDPGLLRELRGELGETAAHDARQLLLRARVEHHVRDAAHEILAEADLRVHLARRGDDLAAPEVAEVPGDRRRADVERDPVGGVVEAGPDGGRPSPRRARRP